MASDEVRDGWLLPIVHKPAVLRAQMPGSGAAQQQHVYAVEEQSLGAAEEAHHSGRPWGFEPPGPRSLTHQLPLAGRQDPLAQLADLAMAMLEPEPDNFTFSLQGELISCQVSNRGAGRVGQATHSNLVKRYLAAQPLSQQQLRAMHQSAMSKLQATNSSVHKVQQGRVLKPPPARQARSNPGAKPAVPQKQQAHAMALHLYAAKNKLAQPTPQLHANSALPAATGRHTLAKQPALLPTPSHPFLPQGLRTQTNFNLLKAAMCKKDTSGSPPKQHAPSSSEGGSALISPSTSPASAGPQPWLVPSAHLMEPIVTLPTLSNEQQEGNKSKTKQSAAQRKPLQSVPDDGASQLHRDDQLTTKQAGVIIVPNTSKTTSSKQQWSRPGRGYTSKAEASDVVKKVVEIPGTEFGVDVPGMYYRAQVLHADKQHAAAVVIKMLDDGSRYYFSIGQVRHWLQEAQERHASEAADRMARVARRSTDSMVVPAAAPAPAHKLLHAEPGHPTSSVSEHSHSAVPGGAQDHEMVVSSME